MEKRQMAVRAGIGGIAGRMGQAIVQAASTSGAVDITCGVVRAGGARPTSVPEIRVAADPREIVREIDVFIDVSTPAALQAHLSACREAGVPYVTGVTGLTDEHDGMLRDAAADIPVFRASNFSVGVAVMAELVRMVAEWLPDYDLEIVELHHRRKRDAPSGTALTLLEAAQQGRGETSRVVHGRHGESLRESGEIGMHSLRGGGNAGEHQVLVAGEGEEVWIGHRALSRATFAEGAVRAARWLVEQPHGLYGMPDFLGRR
jgi:4-hydroxy-tetrahydrodipicolinate reductase